MGAAMIVRVLLFARARELAGRDAVEVELATGSGVAPAKFLVEGVGLPEVFLRLLPTVCWPSRKGVPDVRFGHRPTPGIFYISRHLLGQSLVQFQGFMEERKTFGGLSTVVHDLGL